MLGRQSFDPQQGPQRSPNDQRAVAPPASPVRSATGRSSRKDCSGRRVAKCFRARAAKHCSPDRAAGRPMADLWQCPGLRRRAVRAHRCSKPRRRARRTSRRWVSAPTARAVRPDPVQTTADVNAVRRSFSGRGRQLASPWISPNRATNASAWSPIRSEWDDPGNISIAAPGS